MFDKVPDHMTEPREKFLFAKSSDPLKPTFVTHTSFPRFTMMFEAGGPVGFFSIAPIVSDEEYEPLKLEARKFWEKAKG